MLFFGGATGLNCRIVRQTPQGVLFAPRNFLSLQAKEKVALVCVIWFAENVALFDTKNDFGLKTHTFDSWCSGVHSCILCFASPAAPTGGGETPVE